MPAITEHMTVREAADELGVSTQRVYKMIKDGNLPAVRPWPHSVFIPRDAVESHSNRTAEPITIAECKRYISERTSGRDVRSIGGEDLFDLCFEFINERRTMGLDGSRNWAAAMSTRLVS